MTHLNEPEIVRFITKKLSREERKQIILHLAGCAECTEQLAAVASLKTETTEGDVPTMDAAVFEESLGIPRERKRFLQQHLGWEPRPALAGLLLMVVCALMLGDRDKSLEQFRTSEEIALRFTLLPPDGSVVGDHDPLFSWIGVHGADGYRFFLFLSSGVEYWSSTVSDTAVSLPFGVQLLPGEYFWRVEAIMPDTRVIRSELHTFRYAPDRPQ